MNIPAPELRNAERKCSILAEIDEDYSHVIDELQRRYNAGLRVQVIRRIIGGGAGPVQIVLRQVERFDT